MTGRACGGGIVVIPRLVVVARQARRTFAQSCIERRRRVGVTPGPTTPEVHLCDRVLLLRCLDVAVVAGQRGLVMVLVAALAVLRLGRPCQGGRWQVAQSASTCSSCEKGTSR